MFKRQVLVRMNERVRIEEGEEPLDHWVDRVGMFSKNKSIFFILSHVTLKFRNRCRLAISVIL